MRAVRGLENPFGPSGSDFGGRCAADGRTVRDGEWPVKISEKLEAALREKGKRRHFARGNR